jgi:predicted dehydrogenase
MKKGLSVFCEKPVALQDHELALLLETQKRTNEKVMIGHVVRFTPEYAYLKDAVQDNRFGKLVSGVFQRLSAHPGWTSGNWIHNPALSGGVAIDMHIHDVDFVRYLLGEPDRIQSAAYRDKEGLIQQIISLYSYGTDIAVSLEAAWDYPAEFPFDANYRVKFEEATVLYKNNVLTVYPNSGAPFQPELAKFSGEHAAVQGNISDLGGYYNELVYFCEKAKKGEKVEKATLADGVSSLKFLLKELKA